MGGVLFIDEAYYLYRPENERDYGDEAIEILLQVMENERDDLVVILAGYKDRMDDFFRSNPGMSSRVAHHIDFPDYTVDELMRIAELMLDRRGLRALRRGRGGVPRVPRRGGCSQPRFAHARSVRNAIERTRLRQASRLVAAGGRLGRADLMSSDAPTYGRAASSPRGGGLARTASSRRARRAGARRSGPCSCGSGSAAACVPPGPRASSTSGRPGVVGTSEPARTAADSRGAWPSASKVPAATITAALARTSSSSSSGSGTRVADRGQHRAGLVNPHPGRPQGVEAEQDVGRSGQRAGRRAQRGQRAVEGSHSRLATVREHSVGRTVTPFALGYLSRSRVTPWGCGYGSPFWSW